jgi:hypothetical protein
MASDRSVSGVLAVAAVLAALSPAASAALYVCTDAKGRTITADRPPPECANVPIRELRPDGSVRRVIEPPLTDEQRRARAEKARRDYQEQEVRRAQARRDIALMETYTSEDQIEAARQAALAGRQVIIDRSRQRLESLAAERVKLDNEAEFYASRKRPEKLEHAIEANKELAQAEHRLIADMQVDLQRINKRFDTELARFRELVLAGAKPLMRTGDSALH